MTQTTDTEEYPIVKAAKLECANCGTEWDTDYNKLNDNLDAHTKCDTCGWCASAWNFIPKVKANK